MSLLRRSTAPSPGERLPVRGPRWWERVVWSAAVVAWLCRRAFLLCRWSAYHWAVTLTLGMSVGLWLVARVVGWGPVLLVVVAAVVSLWTFAMFTDRTLERRTWDGLRAWWRWVWTYRRWWQPVLTTSGLALGSGPHQQLPRIRRVRVDGPADLVHVTMLDGQTASDWHDRRERLAEAFGARSCRVYSHGPRSRRLVLEFVIPGRVRGPAAGEGW